MSLRSSRAGESQRLRDPSGRGRQMRRRQPSEGLRKYCPVSGLAGHCQMGERAVDVKSSPRSNASGPSSCRAEAETGGHCHEVTGSPVPSPSGSVPMTHQPSSSQVMG